MAIWGLRLLRNCNAQRYDRNKGRMLRLAEYSRDCLRALRADTGIAYDERMQGTLQLFRTAHQLDGAEADMAILARFGIRHALLDQDGCIAAEPALARVKDKIAGGLRLPDDETGDCFLFTQALADQAAALGVKFQYGLNVLRLRHAGGVIEAVEAGDPGQTFVADAYVLALGSYSPLLLKPLGFRLPVYPVKGYSLTFPISDPGGAPESTVMDETYKVAVTRLGNRVRVGGTAELSGYDLTLRQSRKDTLAHVVRDLFPAAGDSSKALFWTGLRPMTPDGPPVIGRSPFANLYLNTGPWHAGLDDGGGIGPGAGRRDFRPNDPGIDLSGLGLEPLGNSSRDHHRGQRIECECRILAGAGMITTTNDAGSRVRRGAALLLEILRSEGVEYVFGNPGTTELPLMDALLETPDISYILALQEASAVAMADGYAQAAHKPGFLNLHTAGGLGHGMGNLLNASVTQTPLVVTAGQQDSRHTITDPLLFGDLVSIALPAVKWAHEVAHADQLPVLVRRAFHDAYAAPTGPVFLSLPMDVMEEMSGVGIDQPSTIDRRPVAGSLDRLCEYLAGIAPGRLLIIAGDEVHWSGAAAEVAELAELLGAPVYCSSWPSRIPFPTNHPLWSGKLPHNGREAAALLGRYDAVFALGGKSLITVLYTEGSAVPPGCDIFQMSADVRDLGRTYPTRLSVVGDIRDSLRVLNPVLRQAPSPPAPPNARRWPPPPASASARNARSWKCWSSRNGARRSSHPGRGARGDAGDRAADRHRRRGGGHLRPCTGFSQQSFGPSIFLPARRRAGLGHASGDRGKPGAWAVAGRVAGRRWRGALFAPSAVERGA